MIVSLSYQGQSFGCDLSKPLDISLEVGQAKCFYAPDPIAEPLVAGDFIGAVKEGAPVNFFNLRLNPHGNGTHTECLGHITPEQNSVNQQLTNYHFFAQLVSVFCVKKENDDLVIDAESLKNTCPEGLPPALIIRTLPNTSEKIGKDYSGTNPPYLTSDAMRFLVEKGVQHLLLDLPSVDREQDGGKLAAHHIFWGLDAVAKSERQHCTITELVYVENAIEDGLYFLNLQIPSIALDAVPSKPVLYRLNPTKHG